jgi:hypothetical protein
VARKPPTQVHPTPPAPPPEGVLLEQARTLANLTQRQAGRVALMSEARWRQLVHGYRSAYPQTGYIQIIGHADTIARMALAVNLGPDDFKEVRPDGTPGGNRPDVAAALQKRRLIDTPPDPAQFGPARLAELLTEVKEFYGDDVFFAALNLIPPTEGTAGRNTMIRTRH